jgi:hypothetical protein
MTRGWFWFEEGERRFKYGRNTADKKEWRWIHLTKAHPGGNIN